MVQFLAQFVLGLTVGVSAVSLLWRWVAAGINAVVVMIGELFELITQLVPLG